MKGSDSMSINLESNAVQIRENRLGSITGYNGTASDLDEKSRNGKLRDHDTSFTQCTSCSSNCALCQLCMIRDAAVVNHAPIGCSGDFSQYNFLFRSGLKTRHFDVRNTHLINTNLEERDMVYGGASKLEQGIREAKKRFSPKAIFVTTSCASGIIADDIESIAESMEKEVKVPVIPIYCEGFRSKIWATGFDAAYHGILKKIVKKPKEKRRDLINVINFWGSDVYTDLFGKIGLKPNYIVPFSSIEQLEKISEAAATVQMCSTLGTYLAAGLEKKFGVTEIKSPPPYGIAGTDSWLREIGKAVGKEKEVDGLIVSEKRRIEKDLIILREKLKGKTAFISAGAVHGHSIICILKELGMNVTGSCTWHHDAKFDNEDIKADSLKHVVETYGDFKFGICNKQSYEIVNILNRLKPDIFIARHHGMSVWGAKLGIPTLLMGDEHFGLGYQGLINYGYKMLDIISNPSYVKKLSQHCKLPYTKWWMNQDPYTFLEGEQK